MEEDNVIFEQLDRNERRVVMALFGLPPWATFTDIRAEMPQDFRRQNLHTTLANLVEKGIVLRREVDGQYHYRTTLSRKKAFKHSLEGLTKTFAKNSGPRLLESLLAFGFISQQDLQDAVAKEKEKDQQ